MDTSKLQTLLESFSTVSIAVVGDYFLDQYWHVDPRLEESSVETGLRAHQVVAVRTSPGAAGTVVNNLAALGVGRIEAIGAIGQDGNAFQLMKHFEACRVGCTGLVSSDQIMTPTYTKPMRLGGSQSLAEMERFDIKNRRPLPRSIRREISSRLHQMLTEVQAVIIGDQVPEAEFGIVTGDLRKDLEDFSLAFPGKHFFADSRARIGQFRNMMIKPNLAEAQQALGLDSAEPEVLAPRLYERCSRPVFLTLGSRGIAVFDGSTIRYCPALPAPGPIDIVGAGDSATAGIVATLCAGYDLVTAAQMGNLAAGVTIRKLGTTGTASPSEILGLAKSFGAPQES